MRIVDRYVLGCFLRSYLICLVSLIGLYVVIDAFTNLDEFSEDATGFFSLLGRVSVSMSWQGSCSSVVSAGALSAQPNKKAIRAIFHIGPDLLADASA